MPRSVKSSGRLVASRGGSDGATGVADAADFANGGGIGVSEILGGFTITGE
ncbi:MAG: hypothetical protein IT426_19485 [Pirellulales bacterium]|nr:hypothetical protein [Pirellulales bacterium]